MVRIYRVERQRPKTTADICCSMHFCPHLKPLDGTLGTNWWWPDYKTGFLHFLSELLAFYTLLWRERHQSVLSETREKIVEDKNMLCPD